jgi:Ca2+-binding EF-hand superfamily protein
MSGFLLVVLAVLITNLLWRDLLNFLILPFSLLRFHSHRSFILRMNIDTTKIRPVPIQATLLLVNNFIINTTKFLNTFSDACDEKLSKVSSRLSDLDIVLSILEAKLGSIPGLEYTTNDLPPTTTAAAPQPTSLESTLPPAGAPLTAAPPPPPPGGAFPSAPIETSTAMVAQAPDTIPAAEHPDYADFFKLLRVGVPPPVVKAKLSAAGLDPSYVDTPDRMVPRHGSAAAGGGGSSGTLPTSKIIFNKFDPNGTGSIGVKQFQSMTSNFGVWLAGEELSLAIQMIDTDGSGTIEYNEFLRWYQQSSFATLSLDDKALQRRHDASLLFSKYDDDRSGSIDRREFVGFHQELVMKNLTTYSVEKALEDIDMNGDGKIQFNEFVFWLERH